MKKITLTFFSSLLFIGMLFSQTNTTGENPVPLSTTTGLEMGVKIDVTATQVTLQLGGPDDRWLGVGFGVQSMTNGGDVVIFDGTNLTDRTFLGVGTTPALDANQDWTITAIDTSVQGYVGIEATRPITTSDASDYDFNLTDTSINLVWARGDGTFTLGYHGFNNKGITSAGFTLGVEDYYLSEFKISPNPVSTEFRVELPNDIENANVEVFNVLGKSIYYGEISNLNPTVSVSNWNSGIYMVRVSSGNISQTKRIIKQ